MGQNKPKTEEEHRVEHERLEVAVPVMVKLIMVGSGVGVCKACYLLSIVANIMKTMSDDGIAKSEIMDAIYSVAETLPENSDSSVRNYTLH